MRKVLQILTFAASVITVAASILIVIADDIQGTTPTQFFIYKFIAIALVGVVFKCNETLFDNGFYAGTRLAKWLKNNINDEI